LSPVIDDVIRSAQPRNSAGDRTNGEEPPPVHVVEG